MKKILIIISTSLLFGWNMQGFTATTTPPNIKTWCYQNNTWKNNFNYGNFEQINEINGGEACWTHEEINLNLDKKDTYNWHEGWNFISPVFKNWNLDEKFKGNALVAWKYENGEWKVYYKKPVKGIKSFDNINIGEGMFVYIPKIDVKINNQAIFCKEGICSDVITANKDYKFYLKAPQNKQIKFAFDLYRYSNNTHYKLAVGPFKIINTNINEEIPVCVEKEGIGGSCGEINNISETFLTYINGYLSIDAQKIANHFNKSIPNTSEKFKMKFYIEGFNLANFINENFGTLGMEGFGTWVTLNNSKRIEFEMELK
jgi:hypothetical protein